MASTVTLCRPTQTKMQHIRPPKSVASTWHIMPLTTGFTSHPMPIGAVGSSTEAYLAVKYYSPVGQLEKQLIRENLLLFMARRFPSHVSNQGTLPSMIGVHGIESIQFRDYELPETVRTSLKCSIKSLAWKTKFKQKMAAIRTSLNMILEALGVI
ncbi:hypothetical protein YC2023_018175 [Brassica napus]